MGNSKIVFGGRTLIDLTADTVEADKLKKGYTAHGADGELIEGTCEHDANTQDATATDSEILFGKTAYVRGVKKTGKMPNNGAIEGEISTRDGEYSVPQGYHDGSGKVRINSLEKTKLVPENIREGISILGVEGEMTGTEDAKPQSKKVTPTTEEQVVLPDIGYNYLSEVTVHAIPYTESDNAAGGKTITIG